MCGNLVRFIFSIVVSRWCNFSNKINFLLKSKIKYSNFTKHINNKGIVWKN